MKRSILIFFFLTLFLFPACKSEKQEASAPPPESQQATSGLELFPSDATREAAFYLKSQTIDLSKAKVQWFINDKIVEGAASPQLKSSEIKKRDIIYAKVLAGNQEILSNRIEIRNIPPVIASIKINPSRPKVNDILKADVTANDRDGDNVTFLYEWTNNGDSAGNGETLEGPFKRGDKISLKITPYDEEDYGQTVVPSTIIYNASPKVTGGGAEKFENNVYIYQIYASDPDGDELVYSLIQAPEGMVIDPKTGLIRWKTQENDSGRHAVSVKVSDGQGGDILYNFDITIGFK